MLPRNHSLTTPVRLMPQFERGFVPPGQYEFNQGYPFWTNQDFNPPNYYFHRGYSTAVMPSYPQKGFRSEPYWCPVNIAWEFICCLIQICLNSFKGLIIKNIFFFFELLLQVHIFICEKLK